MEVKKVLSHTVTIYIAGSYDAACELFRKECFLSGWCVTIKKTKFIYTGGEEDGVEIGIVNYPRFPSEPAVIDQRVKNIIPALMDALYQRSALVVTGMITEWYSRPCPGERQ